MNTIMVSGAGRGLGLAICEKAITKGYRVVGLGRTCSAEFEALDNAHFIRFDLAERDKIPGLMRDIHAEYGALAGLVNNAGVGNDGVLGTMHASDISRVLTINLEAAILMTKFATRRMLRRGSGSIVNISSIIASTGYSGLSVYAASKAGLEGFTRSLSREIGKAGLRINCVAPGYMETDMTASLAGEKLESVRRRAPLGLPKVDVVANAVLFLLSEDASAITGTTITVDGGATA
jgi:3-oxoacyl-[acyl-carrier protein] reductase